jgi:hypothetical protein
MEFQRENLSLGSLILEGKRVGPTTSVCYTENQPEVINHLRTVTLWGIVLSSSSSSFAREKFG